MRVPLNLYIIGILGMKLPENSLLRARLVFFFGGLLFWHLSRWKKYVHTVKSKRVPSKRTVNEWLDIPALRWMKYYEVISEYIWDILKVSSTKTRNFQSCDIFFCQSGVEVWLADVKKKRSTIKAWTIPGITVLSCRPLGDSMLPTVPPTHNQNSWPDPIATG